MSDFENRIFDSIKKPPIYLRYVKDILILANNINKINKTPSKKFSSWLYSWCKQKKNSFLDVLIGTNNLYLYLQKKHLIITPVPSTLKVNAPSKSNY